MQEAIPTMFCNNVTIMLTSKIYMKDMCDDLNCVLCAILINDVELCLPHWSLADLESW